MALSLDLIGGSSYIWHRTHNILHHTYVNVTGYDLDIDLGFLARLTPYQKHLPIHRFQHWYMWPLFSFAAIRWQLVDDFRHFLAGRFGPSRLTRPRGWDLVVFLTGKLTFFSLAFGVPLLWHRWWVVLLFYGVVSCVPVAFGHGENGT
jgi:linoleoyl-CoA desaturase